MLNQQNFCLTFVQNFNSDPKLSTLQKVEAFRYLFTTSSQKNNTKRYISSIISI